MLIFGMMKKDNDTYLEVSSLNTYIREIEKVPLLSKEEEYELALKAKNGDINARNRIVEANSRFVISVAKKYQNRGIPLEDLISEGNVGLIMAIDKFEPEKGFHFISYAVWWIRQSILKALSDKARLIRLPVNKCNDLAKIYHSKNKLEEQGLNSEIEDIALDCGLSYEDVADILNYSKELVSLDAPVNVEEDSFVGDFIESSEIGPEASAIETSLTEAIDFALNSFSDKEKDIIERRYGLKNKKPLSLQEVGDIYGLTKERIRQIEKKVLGKLQEDQNICDLKAYLA